MPDNRLSLFRRASDYIATSLAWLAAILVLLPLVVIFGYLVFRGAGSLDLNFFTKIPKPVGEIGGGMANAIAGSGIILGIASLIGVIVSHVIVLFDFIEEMHARGEPLRDALLDAGIVRLRPVLITGRLLVIQQHAPLDMGARN